MSKAQPVQMDSPLVDILSATVRELEFRSMRLPSGAGHDAQPMASLCPAGMLFVPSVGGISHSPDEYTTDDDIVAGVQALTACWWQVAQWRTALEVPAFASNDRSGQRGLRQAASDRR